MMGGAGEEVLYGVESGVARITLNRPERLNASNGALSRGLTEAFGRAAADPAVRVILLSGAGKGFCAGADMQVLGELSADPNAPNSGSGGLRYDGLTMLDKPVIAAVHGACAGMGLALACCADVRIAARDAFFLAPFVRLGLCAEGGLAWLLSRAMGPGNAADMLLSGRRIGAAEALAKGLVSQVLPDEGFVDAAFAYAAAMAEGAPRSFALIKAQLRDAVTQDFPAAREASADAARETLQADDFREAMAARREKRVPRFVPVTGVFKPPVSGG
ncbi:MAG: enoyl-CoA hydratase-related protein [Novosphingobium sp.]|nr:enoyl-CoA hydratase-related protein [Novosphingobium sp.]